MWRKRATSRLFQESSARGTPYFPEQSERPLNDIGEEKIFENGTIFFFHGRNARATKHDSRDTRAATKARPKRYTQIRIKIVTGRLIMRTLAMLGIAAFIACQAAPLAAQPATSTTRPTPNAPASTAKTPAPTEAQPHQQPVAPPTAPLPAENAASNKSGIDLGADPMGMYLDEAAREAHPKGQMTANMGHWYADPNNYHPFNKVTWHKDDCFPVTRRAYDKTGQQVTDTARMCYKEDGSTMIAAGSHKTVYQTDVAGPR
jgi:hypothetical protein